MEKQAVAALRRALGGAAHRHRAARHRRRGEREAARLRKAGRTGHAANIIFAVAKQIFRDARGVGVFTLPSPAAELKAPAKSRPRASAYLYDGRVLRDMIDPDRNEVGALVATLRSADMPGPDPGTRAALLLGLMLGTRAGEIAALEWSAVRLDDATPALHIVSGKTKSATRTLPLPHQAVAILRSLKPRAHGARFSSSPPGCWSRRTLPAREPLRALRRIFRQPKHGWRVLHDMRRTCLGGILVELSWRRSARPNASPGTRTARRYRCIMTGRRGSSRC